MSERRQISAPQVGPAHHLRHQRRAPTTPPLPLRSLQLVPKQPDAPVMFRDRRKVRVHGPGARDSWPGAGTKSRMRPSCPLAPDFSEQPITEAWHQTGNQPQINVAPSGQVSPISQNPQFSATPHPHWSVPVIAPTGRGGSEATMMSLLLFCHR